MPIPTLVHSVDSPSPSAKRQALEPKRRELAKIAFTCRRVPTADMKTLVRGPKPEPGDVVLARVRRKRQHPRIELPTGRKSLLYVGDEIIVGYGNRYATDQFEAVVPEDLEACHLVASGGVAARVVSRSRAVRPATEIEPIGLIGDADGRPLNLSSYGLQEPTVGLSAPCVAVVGSSMNAGKTTSAARIIHGLTRAGHRVGAAKITGTGSGGDYWKFLDAGAHAAVDFTDAGHVSTHRVETGELLRIARNLTGHLVDQGAEIVVVEIADGLLQEETAALLSHPDLRSIISGYLLAVTDPMSALAGAEWLAARDLTALALCGTLTRSPLATREALDATGLPVLSLGELGSPQIAHLLMSALHLPAAACAGESVGS